MGKRNNKFDDSARLNNLTYRQYINRLTELALSCFEWRNLPETIDSRYLEMCLFETGSCIYFKDEVIGDLCLSNLSNGNFNVYGEPYLRRAYSRYNNYQKLLSEKNSVIIWNNLLRENSVLDVEMFALRLYKIDRMIDVNVNAQKTPILLQGSDKQRLTLNNLYMQYDGNQPFIFGDQNLDLNCIKVIKTDAPFVADKLQELKANIWNEALTYLGISNITINKKERLITDEVMRSQGGTIASRYSRLDARQNAAEKINRMFGTEIEVDFKENLKIEGSEDFEQIYDGS